MTTPNRLWEIVHLFLTLGSVAFGGPAAHIAMLEEEVVKKRKWMTGEHFLDLVGATNLIPGPNSTEMVFHCGYERAGWKGLCLAGACFIFPAVLLTAALAWLYQEYGQLPQVEPFFYGIQAAVIVIIAMAAYRLGKKAFKSTFLLLLSGVGLAAALWGVTEIIILLAGGAAAWLAFRLQKRSNILPSFAPLLLFQVTSSGISSSKIFLTFLKIGAILYGSGYVLFAFLETELVAQGWLTSAQLLDAVAIGQITPGPVLSTATFIGWQMNGLSGAVAATLGIFLPSFIFVAILNPLLPRLQKLEAVRAFLNGVNAMAVALIVGVCITMGQSNFDNWRSIVIAGLTALILWRFPKFNSAWIVVAAALLGYVLTWV